MGYARALPLQTKLTEQSRSVLQYGVQRHTGGNLADLAALRGDMNAHGRHLKSIFPDHC